MLKYCSVCNIYQPPRAVHCEKCNACVLIYDHHSGLVANCVGKRTFKYYFWFLFCVFLNFYHVIIQNSYDLSRRIKADLTGEKMSDVPWVHFIKTYGQAIYILPVAVVGFIVSQRFSYINFRKARRNTTGDEKIVSYNNPFDLGTWRANIRDRFAYSEPLYMPNALYDP